MNYLLKETFVQHRLPPEAETMRFNSIYNASSSTRDDARHEKLNTLSVDCVTVEDRTILFSFVQEIANNMMAASPVLIIVFMV